MENIVLVFPTEEMETQALEFKKDFFDSGEKTINGSYRLDMNKYTYLEWLQMLKDNLNDKKVTDLVFHILFLL